MCIRDRDSGYFHNNKKLANRKSVKNAVLELQNSYQNYFEENKDVYKRQGRVEYHILICNLYWEKLV